MTTTTEDGDRQNIFAIEPEIKIMEVNESHNVRSELLNGRLAMLGFIIAVGTYATTGQIIPGVF